MCSLPSATLTTTPKGKNINFKSVATVDQVWMYFIASLQSEIVEAWTTKAVAKGRVSSHASATFYHWDVHLSPTECCTHACTHTYTHTRPFNIAQFFLFSPLPPFPVISINTALIYNTNLLGKPKRKSKWVKYIYIYIHTHIHTYIYIPLKDNHNWIVPLFK